MVIRYSYKTTIFYLYNRLQFVLKVVVLHVLKIVKFELHLYFPIREVSEKRIFLKLYPKKGLRTFFFFFNYGYIYKMMVNRRQFLFFIKRILFSDIKIYLALHFCILIKRRNQYAELNISQ